MPNQVIELAQQLIAIQSESLMSNASISDFLQDWLEKHGLTVERFGYRDSNGVEKVNLIAKLGAGPVNVPFGTEAESYQRYTQCVVLGPGSIGQAHTVNEFVKIDQLEQAVTAFQHIIAELCMA